MKSIFEEILQKNIEVYCTDPSRLREDAENERAIVDDYQGRAILELLQNADDAQFSSPDDQSNLKRIGDHFVEFELNEKCLIVRNSGYPITPEGVRSLAGMRISPKNKRVMIGNKGIGFKSVLELTDQPIINSAPFHFKFSEEDTSDQLKKENLLSILDETKYVPVLRLPFELSSGQKRKGNGIWATEILLPLRDQRAYEKSVDMLSRISPEVLIFLRGLRIISYKGDDDEICFSRDRENNIPGELIDGEVIISEQSETVSRYYRWVKTVLIPENIKEKLPRNWQDLTHGQVAIAVLLEYEGSIERSNENKIHVYFPTEEFSPVNILIHGNLRTDSSRKRILPEAYNQWVLGLTGLLLKEKVINKFQSEFPEDQGKILDYLEPRIDVQKMDGIEREIWLSIDKNLKDYRFVLKADTENKTSPQNTFIPPDIIKHQLRTIFSQNYSIEGRYLPESSFISSKTRINALLALGAEKIEPEKIILALDDVAQPDTEWCIKAFNLVLAMIQSQPKWQGNINYWQVLVRTCCSIKIFLCSDSKLRKIDSNYPLFLPSKEKDEVMPSPPEFLNFAFLSKEIIDALDENNRERFGDLFVTPEDIAIHHFNKNSILQKVVTPWLERNSPSSEQAITLRKFLFDLMGMTKTELDEPWNEKEGVRSVLCRLPVPLRNAEESPAWQVYAGKEWTEEESLERLYGGRRGRFFLEAPKPEWDEKTKKRWEAFYKWLGVSWRPKVLPYHLPGEQKRDSTWNHGQNVFSLQWPEISKENWEKYCYWLKEKEVNGIWHKDLFYHSPHMMDNRFLDGWERISKDIELGKTVLQLLTKELLENNKSAEVKYSSNQQKDYQNETWKPPSFFVYMLKNYPWLPAVDQQGNVAMHSAFDLFIPDSQLDRAFSKILPRLNIKDKLTKQTENFFKAIGIRSEFRELDAEDWIRWATSMRKWFPNPDKEEIEKITSFYRKLLDEFPEDGKQLFAPPLGDVDVLAFKGEKGEQWGYCKPQECWYLDKPEHKELVYMIHDKWFFAVKLGKKSTKCKELFGLSPFSESLIPKPLPGIIDNGLTDKLAMWFESRQPFLLARLSIERPKSRDKDKDYLKRMKIQCVESLKVSYHIQDREISTRLEDAFLENLNDEQSILYLSSKIIILPFPECRDLISHIAKNLEYRLDAPYKDAFKSILSCKDDYLLKELEEAYVSSDLIEECKRSLEEKREVEIYRESETTVKEPIKMQDHEEGNEYKSIFEKQRPTRDAVRSQEEPSSKFKNGEISGAETQPEYIGSELGLVSESNGGGGSGGEERDHATERDQKVTGERGEDILFKYFKNSLQNFGFDANCKLLHKSKEDPHSIYDIEVIDNMKGVFYLEVKSTSSNRPTLSFEMSYRQWKFAREKQDRYQLWFVFDIAGNRPKISGPHKPLVLESQGKLKKTPKEEIVYSCKVKLKG